MIIYGYAYEYMYTGESTLKIKVRIPSIHGPMNQQDVQGKQIKSYTQDKDLPWIDSLILPHLPNRGDVVCLISDNDTNPDFLVIGITGGNNSNMYLN